MANWKSTITDTGTSLVTQALATGSQVKVTAVKFGDHKYATLPEDPAALAELGREIAIEGYIANVAFQEGLPAITTFSVIASNKGLTQNTPVREIGLFVGDKLFAYAFLADKYDSDNVLGPNEATDNFPSTFHTFELVIATTTQQKAVLEIEFVPEGFVRQEHLKESLTAHDTDPEAHQNLKLSGVPVGSILLFPAEELPAGFLPCDGAYLDREAYKDLFEVIGNKYGEGDGINTFSLPDLRGYFVRGLDDGKGIDPERELGSVQGDAIRNITGFVQTGGGDNGYVRGDGIGAFYTSYKATSRPQVANMPVDDAYNELNFDASRVVPTAEENRPKNIALIYAIKVFGVATNTGEVDVAKLAESVAELTNTLQQPAGSVLAFAGQKAPSGYLVCDGGEVGRATYPDLFEAIGTIYGAGDGTATFNLPDLRGQFLRGLGGNSAELGERQGDAIRNITGRINTGQGSASPTTGTGAVRLGTEGAFSPDTSTECAFVIPTGQNPPSGPVFQVIEFDVSKAEGVQVAEENRPVNMAILYCIKAFGSKTNVGQIDITELAQDVSRLYSQTRKLLRQNTTIYIRKDGNDNNDGLTEQTAFATVARAIDYLNTVDGGGNDVTISLGVGTWSDAAYEDAPAILSFPRLVGIDTLVIEGLGMNETILNGNNTLYGFLTGHTNQKYEIKNMRMGSTLANIYCRQDMIVISGNMYFGYAASACISCGHHGVIIIAADCTITGGAASYFAHAHTKSTIFSNIGSWNFIDTTYPGGVVRSDNGSLIGVSAAISGTNTGYRYSVVNNAIIDTNGRGENYFPGTIAGAVFNGGIYT